VYVCAPPGRDSNWDYTPVRALCTNVLIQDVLRVRIQTHSQQAQLCQLFQDEVCHYCGSHTDGGGRMHKVCQLPVFPGLGHTILGLHPRNGFHQLHFRLFVLADPDQVDHQLGRHLRPQQQRDCQYPPDLLQIRP